MTWSREQSQQANRKPISSGLKSRATGNLQSQSEKQKAFARRSKGIKMRWSVNDTRIISDKPKEREFLLPRRDDYKAPKLRGASGTRLSPAKRAMVELRQEKRKAFFAGLGVTL